MEDEAWYGWWNACTFVLKVLETARTERFNETDVWRKKKRESERARERKSSGVSVHDKIEFSAMVTSSTEHATGPIQIYTPES